MMFCMGLTMRIGLGFAEATHPIFALLINFLLASAAVFVSSYMSTMWGFIAFYGIIFGLVNGMSFVVPMV
jgi:hypothetical protein